MLYDLSLSISTYLSKSVSKIHKPFTIIYNEMNNHELNIFQKNHFDFFEFVTSIDDHIDEFIECFNQQDTKECLDSIERLIDKYHQSKNIYNFKKLYTIDPEWYNFFYENTDSNGIRNQDEKRMGVDKKYVDDIMKIKHKMIYLNGNDAITLDSAVRIYGMILIIHNQQMLNQWMQ